MTCGICSFEFCWLCRNKFTPDHFSTLRVSPCSGRLFTNNPGSVSFCSRVCTFIRNFLILIFFPLIVLSVLIFIIPIQKFLKEFIDTSKQYRATNQLHAQDNRFVNLEIKMSLDKLGRCKLCGWALLSVVALPLTLLIFSIPLAVFLIIWIILVFGTLKGILFDIICCRPCRPNRHAIPRNDAIVRMNPDNVTNVAPH